LVGKSSGKTADIGPKIRPIKNMPMVKKTSTDASVAASMAKNWVKVKPKTMIKAETIAKVGLRPYLSARMEETGIHAINAKMETSCSCRKSVYGMPRPRPLEGSPIPNERIHVVTK